MQPRSSMKSRNQGPPSAPFVPNQNLFTQVEQMPRPSVPGHHSLASSGQGCQAERDGGGGCSLKGWGGPGPMGYRVPSEQPPPRREAPDAQQGRGTRAGAANRPGRSVPEKRAEQVLEEGGPRVGVSDPAPGTGEGPRLPVLSSATSCSRLPGTAPPTAPWGTAGRTQAWHCFLGGIWRAWRRKTCGDTGRDLARPRNLRSPGLRATSATAWHRFPAFLELRSQWAWTLGSRGTVSTDSGPFPYRADPSLPPLKTLIHEK